MVSSSAYGEASKDVHTLLRSTAAHLAMRDWHKRGAHNESEALRYYLTRLRRRWASARAHLVIMLLLCYGWVILSWTGEAQENEAS